HSPGRRRGDVSREAGWAWRERARHERASGRPLARHPRGVGTGPDAHGPGGHRRHRPGRGEGDEPMNSPLRRLSVVVLAMFVLLMGNATWVQYGPPAGALNDDPRNVRTIYREFGRDRGPIVVAGDQVAYSEPVDDPFGFQRIYTDGPLYAPVTGHFSIVFQSTGVERYANDVLNGTDAS